MKQIFRIFTLIAVAMLTAGQAWAGTTADLGFIKRGTVTGGDLMFYKEATCETKISPNSNLYSSDLTDGKVYIKATPDWNYTGIGVTITAQVSTSSSPAEARSITRGSTAPGIGQAITVSPVSDKPGIYSFTMPTDGSNANVSATFKEKPYLGDGTNAHISYYSYDAQGNRVTSNTGDDGHPRVYILDGSETTLGQNGTDPATSKPYETWYVCNSTTGLSYTWSLTLNGDVHLILADNAKMTMDVNAPAIYGYSGDFYIYGQSDNSGKLIATSDKTGITIDGKLYVNGGQVEAIGSLDGIFCKGATINGGMLKAAGSTGINSRSGNSNSANITITGGQVTATGSNGVGIVAYNNVTISGGQVTATGESTDTNGHGILSIGGSITISGGQVIGSGTNYGIISRDIVLGWSNASDYIKASKYSGIVKTAAGQRFVAYTPGATESDPMTATAIISGSIAKENDSYPIDGKTLKPLDGYTVTVADGISVGTLSGTTFTAADPDFTIGTTPYYIYKASTQEAPVTVTLKATDTNKQLGSVTITGADAQDNGDGTFTFTMGTSDVTVTAATFKVSYFDPTVEGDDKTKTATNVTALTSDMSWIGTLGQETWYVVDGDVTIDQELTVSGDVNIILADGGSLTVNSTESENYGIYMDCTMAYGSLTIYSQSIGENMGQLTVTSHESHSVGINVTGLGDYYSHLTINGGLISVTGATTGVYISNDNCGMTVNDGDVTIMGTTDVAINELSRYTRNGGTVRLYDKVATRPITDYVDAAGEAQPSLQATIVSSGTLGETGQTTWYVVNDDKEFTHELNVSGDVNIILADGKELSVNASVGTYGIFISDNSSLTIYTQSHGEDKGKMTLTAGTGLRVGNGSLTINGGLIYVTSTGTIQPAIDVATNGSMTLNNGDVITKAGSDYSVTVNEGSGSGGVIDIPGGGDSFSVVNLTYNRTLTAPTESDNDAIIGGNKAKLYTVCLPTAPTKIDNVKYYTLASVSGTTLNFEEVTTLAEDTPYLMAVIGSSDIPESVTVKNETLTLKKIVTGTTVDGYTMMGTQTGLSNANAISAAGDGKFTYILQHGANWGQVKDDTDAHKAAYIPAFRAFIIGPAVPSNGNARELDSTFDDDATGIQNILTVDRDGTERWYDLNGRRIDQPTKKGIYINNGKKVIKK